MSSADSWFNLYFALPADKTTLCRSNTGNDAVQKPRVAEREMECTGKGSALQTSSLLLGNENLHIHCGLGFICLVLLFFSLSVCLVLEGFFSLILVLELRETSVQQPVSFVPLPLSCCLFRAWGVLRLCFGGRTSAGIPGWRLVPSWLLLSCITSKLTSKCCA